MDAHHCAYVHATVTARAGPRHFYIIPRPLYHPKFSPIEYKICDITQQIKLETKPDWDIAELEQQIMALAMRLGPFDSTFLPADIVGEQRGTAGAKAMTTTRQTPTKGGVDCDKYNI